MINRKRALPLGALVVGLLVMLAAFAVVSGLWSKNLVVKGTVETGDLNVDWTDATPSDDLCTTFNPLNPCHFPRKDVGKFDCFVDEKDHQILHVEAFNAYPSYEADCEYHFANTGSIPFNVIGAQVIAGAGLTGCVQVAGPSSTIKVDCDQITIAYFDNIGRQIDPGDEQSGSLKLHVKQAAEQSDCTANSTVIPGGNPSVVVSGVKCDPDTQVTYYFDVKVCVAQWNEAATYPQCIQSPQHEGPTGDSIIDADGITTRGDGLGTCGLPATAGSQDVHVGDPLNSFPSAGTPPTGLDWFDQDGNGVWTNGCNGDDLHSEDVGTCPTAAGFRNAVHDLGHDCKVLDLNGDLADGDLVSCDLEVGVNFAGLPACPDPLIRYHDANGNGSYDMGEDIVWDGNGDGIFD